MSNKLKTLVGIWYNNYLVLPDGSYQILYWYSNLNRDDYHDKKVAVQVLGQIVQEVCLLPDDFRFSITSNT